jgi:hypothetical protein
MKRTPLRRKTPLKAKPKPGKPRPRLAQASAKQAERLARYHAMVDGWQGPKCCAKCGHKQGLEPHHPFGRGRDNLFKVVLLCLLCHAWVHEMPDMAYGMGWLQPEYRGLMPRPHPIPWKPSHLITDIP